MLPWITLPLWGASCRPPAASPWLGGIRSTALARGLVGASNTKAISLLLVREGSISGRGPGHPRSGTLGLLRSTLDTALSWTPPLSFPGSRPCVLPLEALAAGLRPTALRGLSRVRQHLDGA